MTTITSHHRHQPHDRKVSLGTALAGGTLVAVAAIAGVTWQMSHDSQTRAPASATRTSQPQSGPLAMGGLDGHVPPASSNAMGGLDGHVPPTP